MKLLGMINDIMHCASLKSLYLMFLIYHVLSSCDTCRRSNMWRPV